MCSHSNDQLLLQVVWSTGAKSLILWDAFTGVYLGSVSRMSDAELDRKNFVEHSERDERYVPRMHIDHRKVHKSCSTSFLPNLLWQDSQYVIIQEQSE